MSIEKIDCVTWEIESESEPGKKYMVFNSQHDGWVCDCMWWSIHCKLKPPHPECKHVRKIKETFIKQ